MTNAFASEQGAIAVLHVAGGLLSAGLLRSSDYGSAEVGGGIRRAASLLGWSGRGAAVVQGCQGEIGVVLHFH